MDNNISISFVIATVNYHQRRNIINYDNRIKTIDAELAFLNNELKRMPTGKLYIVNNNGYSKWFNSNGHNHSYIPKKNRKLAEKLAYKKFIGFKIEELQSELYHLKRIHPNPSLSDFVQDSQYMDLLSNYYLSKNKSGLEWMNEDYPRNKEHPENLIHATVNKLSVRSKAESMIAISLAAHGIPFRYECLLELDGLSIYPDFTIMNPENGNLLYWEHFGLMDNPEYATMFSKKIPLYAKNGIILGENLIATFENSSHPLTYNTIESTINNFILN